MRIASCLRLPKRQNIIMIMLKRAVVYAFMCLIAHQSMRAESADIPTYTRVIETQLPNRVTLAIKSTLYTVSKTKQTLNVNSTGINCKLNTDPFDENIEGRMNAAALGDDKQIVVWGVQKSQPQGGNRLTHYTLLLVDPIACSYKVVPLPEDLVPNNYPILQPQLVIENTNFLVFYPTQQGCDSCEYWNWGERLDPPERQFPYHDGVPSSQFWFKPYNDPKIVYYYVFYAYNFDNGTALLKILDMQKFSKGWRALLSATVDAASVSYGTYQNTAICSIFGKDRREVECARLTSQLKIGSSWKLPLNNNLSVSGVSIEVDRVGNTFIGVVDSQQLYCFIYNVDSKLVADLDFGKVDEKYNYREVNGILIDKEFCLVAVVYSDSNVQDDRHVVKCIDISKYLSPTRYNVVLI